MLKTPALKSYVEALLKQYPADWLNLTTHRLDIYNESMAKTEFLQELNRLFEKGISDRASFENLPTAYDYIRLGHPLSSVLEWAVAKEMNLNPQAVISFSSNVMPLLAVLRTNSLEGRNTRILHHGELDGRFDLETLRSVYGYRFEWIQVSPETTISSFEGSTVLLHSDNLPEEIKLSENVDFHLSLMEGLGSVMIVNGDADFDYVGKIQHVRRRESIAMTPANCLEALKGMIGQSTKILALRSEWTSGVRATIQDITESSTPALLASSGLSIQYAIMMGLIDYAKAKHPGKAIKIIVPPNCYGGTNDQARRVAAALDAVDILDLPVDGDNDMVRSTDQVLAQCAELDAVPLIIAEIPTNPRVEVPDLEELKRVLSQSRYTPEGDAAVTPVFILDQTFCPNVQFVSKDGILSSVQTISYVSGSKFPSGGKCTAGYCVANDEASVLMPKIEKHLQLCDNEATAHQVQILNEQMPSMLQRIQDAYVNTREFVSFIEEILPGAKINFVSPELAERGFTPSVFSLDLPTKGDTAEQREEYKRMLNQKLIDKMITELPQDSKYCVSYGQLKGCYWTIPATSTQGTTKEEDKDYIARVSVSGNLDLEGHKGVFKAFVESL